MNVFKILALTLVIVCVLSFPALAAGDLYPESVMLPRTFTDSAGTELPYRIYIPSAAADGSTGCGPGDKLPLLLYLHGSGLRGSDNTAQVANDPGILRRVLNSSYRDCILVAPQCANGAQWVDTPWADGSYSIARVGESRYLRAVYELLLSLSAALPVDTGRIYVTGISMGGYGTWDIIERHPALFAAAAPVCGAGDPSAADAIAGLPIWDFHGGEDGIVPVSGSRDMAAALKSAGSEVFAYTEYPGVGHECWGLAYSEPELLDWLFAQSKDKPSAPPGSGEIGAWKIAGYTAAALLIAASGFGIYHSVRAKTKRSGNSRG